MCAQQQQLYNTSHIATSFSYKDFMGILHRNEEIQYVKMKFIIELKWRSWYHRNEELIAAARKGGIISCAWTTTLIPCNDASFIAIWEIRTWSQTCRLRTCCLWSRSYNLLTRLTLDSSQNHSHSNVIFSLDSFYLHLSMFDYNKLSKSINELDSFFYIWKQHLK